MNCRVRIPTHLIEIIDVIHLILYTADVKQAHRTKTNRRIITAIEWAKYLGISRHTVKQRITQYERDGGNYDSRDIFSILKFYLWLIKTGT